MIVCHSSPRKPPRQRMRRNKCTSSPWSRFVNKYEECRYGNSMKRMDAICCKSCKCQIIVAVLLIKSEFGPRLLWQLQHLVRTRRFQILRVEQSREVKWSSKFDLWINTWQLLLPYLTSPDFCFHFFQLQKWFSRGHGRWRCLGRHSHQEAASR